VLPADDIEVIGHLIRRHIEMSRGAGAAEGAKAAGKGEQQEVRHGAIHVDAEHGGIDDFVRRTAIVTAPRKGEVKGVQRGRTEGVGIADGHRLRALEIASLRRCQDIFAVIGRGVLKVNNEIPSKYAVFAVLYPVDPADYLIFVAGDGDGIGNFAALVG
jgi:hypothetical protein